VLSVALPAALGRSRGLLHFLSWLLQLREDVLQDFDHVGPDRERVVNVRSERYDGEGALIAVQDSGIGIDTAHAGRIFDAFFTTKSEGMGMGLSICQSIVQSHGGRMMVSPGNPHGSVFCVILPANGAGGPQ
jgi:signal transduction histidine kinase